MALDGLEAAVHASVGPTKRARERSKINVVRYADDFVVTGISLPSPVRGKFYYLYLIEDIYSRKAVGWEVREAESDEEAALLQKSVMH